ncbi:endonuclease/exonuclease/phosphatase family protein [Streptomyces sp. NPDC016845]|uniref:endonuclease/exonuclease/phosphatase family protein n=1 Tax=Streptomyces sp. NPDC016845 TaxID=3364972 RepID=UPI0037B14F3A
MVTAVIAVMTLATPSTAADAEVPPSSAGQRWALKVNGYYVTVKAGEGGDMKLRANPDATLPQGRELFTLHTDYVQGASDPYGTTVSLRSEATGRYVTAEDEASGHLLRTRGEVTGAWERFTLTPLAGGTFGLLAHNGKYVKAELGTYEDYGLLRALTDPSELGSWERFTLESVGPQGGYADKIPAPSKPASRSQDVVSWNICANNNRSVDCGLQFAPPATAAGKVSSALHSALGSKRPDAIFFQEICEKTAKPLELELEKWAGPLDVRFMPTYYNVATGTDGTVIQAQKTCNDGSDHADRGSFGIALAVPDSNTWYMGTVLPSPDKKDKTEIKKEQRPMLCAAVPDEGTTFCNAHFSSGPYTDANGKPAGDDTDRDNLFRPKQAATMDALAAKIEAAGYSTYIGGDLNTTTNDVSYLASLYDDHQECGQKTPASPHTGEPTDGNNKIDYIFGPQNLTYTCSVIDGGLSDHRLIQVSTS